MTNLQLTFAIIKPHATKNPYAIQKIREIIISEQFGIVHSERMDFPKELAEKFYEEHKLKFFYNRLLTFMSSGPVEAFILSRPNAIAHWREIMGPTKVFRSMYSHPESIRGLFGLSDTRNACHGSDSTESVRREVGIIFPQFAIDEWYVKNGHNRETRRKLSDF